jgi:glycosyltransferase involved in cell wall biosynthesis
MSWPAGTQAPPRARCVRFGNAASAIAAARETSVRRVAFLADTSPALSPSVWVNSMLLAPFLRAAGWRLDVLPPPAERLVRTFRWLPGVRGLAFTTLVPALRRMEVARNARNWDVVVVHKAMTDMSLLPRAEANLRRRHTAIIFNFDDAVYERGIPFVAERIRLADAVWVGREELAEYSRQYNDNVFVIGSAVDCSHFRCRTDYVSAGPLNLVWTGTAFSHPYLEMLRAPLKRLASIRPFRLQIVSGSHFSFSAPEIADEWVPYSVAAERDALERADVALMPLADGSYERAKENYKIKIYLACGLPVICSPVGANREFVEDGTRGLWAASEDEWLGALDRLARDEALRRRLGQAGRRYIEETYDISVVGPRVAAMFALVSAGRQPAAVSPAQQEG